MASFSVRVSLSIYILQLIPKSNGLVGYNSTWLDWTFGSPKFNLLLMEKDLSPFKIIKVIHFIFSRCLPPNPDHITNIITYNVPLTLFGTFFIEEFSKGFGQWQQWWMNHVKWFLRWLCFKGRTWIWMYPGWLACKN